MTACFSNPALPAGLARRWRGLCRVGLPALLVLATPLAMLLALGIGRFPLPPTEVLGYALAKLGWLSLPPARLALLDNLIIDIRLPSGERGKVTTASREDANELSRLLRRLGDDAKRSVV